MATKFSPNNIQNLSQDWGRDESDMPLFRPYSGRAVQKLVRDNLSELHETKFGHAQYEGGNISFYDEDQGVVISTLALTGTVYAVSLESSTLSTFTVLTNETAKVIVVTPSSKEGTIGSELTEFIEDYTWIASVDSGGGFVSIANGVCSSGNSFSTDIRPYLNVGINRIRFTVTGTTSNQTKSLVLSANLTSLTLNVLHNWQKPWIENEPYYVQGIYFSGNMQKILNVRIDDDDDKVFTQTFSASTSYVGSPYIFNLTSHFPGTTGIHKIDVWITGTGVTTKHFVFDVMCVKTVDRLTAKLICINDLKSKVFNYEDQELFKFATYGTSEATFNLTAHVDGTDYPIVVDQQVNVVSEDKVPYSIRLEVPTELQSGISLSIDASVDSSTVTKTTSVDNSNAFAPVPDATFYMNSSLRNNGSADREMILNNLIDPIVSGYPAVWTGFSWENDGWGTDPQSVKCLSVQAGSSIVSENFKPLSVLGAGQSLTVEWKFKVDSVSDYNTPIMTFMSDDVYNPLTTNGVIVFPTKVLVLTSSNRDEIQQSVNFEEGEQLHFALVFQSGYGATGRNLCRIYINGIQQSVFEYDGSSSFGNGSLKLGQTSTDLYLYMFRTYNGVALESDGILKNWLNALTETMDYSRHGIRMDNDIFDGININYELTKAKGFNTMVVEMEGDIAIPSLSNNVKAKSSVSVEYANNPEWNFRITNAPIDGQGTTSMRYAKWNLRWKLAKGADASIWNYADSSVSTTKGWFDGASNHPKVSRITAKKNIASSSQGHKMGATKMYDDLYKELGLNHDLLPGARVSVYQYPVMGFQKYADGSYTFIGLYTIGPDKGDSDTFGYDTSIFPELLSIEGPNHAPLGTRFIHPWIDMVYDGDEETLTFGGQEGWDIASYNDGKYSTNEGVLTLFENEWKPAYDIVYFCSTYLRSIAETGLTLSEINSNIIEFRNASNLLTTRKNEVVTLYDGSYNLVYYRISTNQYEILAGHDVRTYLAGYLVNMTDPTTQELIVARKAKFVAEMENYYDIESLLYHENFLFLIGASDNHAKNLYPFKLKSLAEGGRWEFRQDDMDTILATDNNGNPTKNYYVEPGDLTPGGTDIYQGSSSVLWSLIREVYQDRLRAMMIDMINAMVAIAGRRGLTKGTIHQTIFAIFDYYFWRTSAKYFPVRAYAEDTVFGYIGVWASNPGATYNGVYPLTQALGTQLEAEKYWALRRIIYTFSKYSIGGFNGSSDDGLSSIEFTPGQAYTFNLTPAINMYPSGNLGGGTNTVGARTAAGDVCQIVANSDGTTTYYLKSLDWLTSLGDLSNLVLTSRGGVSTINFSVKSKRLRALKFGDANPSNVLFNATVLDVQGAGIEEIDLRNVISIQAPVDLSNCPRLKSAKFEGSTVPTVILPAGSKISYLSLPSTAQNIYLNGLPFLTEENFDIPPETFNTIRGLYVSNCPGLNIFDILRNILSVSGNGLRFISLAIGEIAGTVNDVAMLVNLTTPYDTDTDTGFGRVNYDTLNKIYSYNGQQIPYIQGTINLPTPGYERDILAIRGYFSQLILNVTEYYMWFEDLEVRSILSTAYGDGTGVTSSEALALTSLGNVFTGNTDITSFEELKDLHITSIGANCFKDCVNLNDISIPATVTSIAATAFEGCSGATKLSLPLNYDLDIYSDFVFGNFTPASLYNSLMNCENGEVGDLKEISIHLSVFQNLIAAYPNVIADVNAKFITLKNVGFVPFITPAGFTESSDYATYGEEIDIYSTFNSYSNPNKKYAYTVASTVVSTVFTAVAGRTYEYTETVGGVQNAYIVLASGTITWASGSTKRHVIVCNTNASETIANKESVMSSSWIYVGKNCVFSAIQSSMTTKYLHTYNSVTSIGNFAFQNCRGFTGSLTIPDSVTSIGIQGFYACSGFTGSLIIPDSVTTIGNDAFYNCTGFTGSLAIPNSVTSIGNGAFQNCTGFKGSLTIPNSITSIGVYTFYNCSGFTGSLTIPNSVTSIGAQVFQNCSGFTGSLTIPDSVTSIGSDAFSGCSGFTGSLTIPDSVTSIGVSTFANCKFNAITSTSTRYPSYDNVLYAEVVGGFNPILNATEYVGTLTFREDTKSIGGLAFAKRTGNLTIPNSVTIISTSVFANCTGFTGSLVIPDSVTSIGNQAFSGCTGFTGSLTIPNSVTSIGFIAFSGCTGFTGSLTIPDSVTIINTQVFNNCSGFTGNLIIPNSVTSIGSDAFNRCAGFAGSLTIPNSVTSIGNSAFRDCTGFTGSLTIPDSVTSIGVSTFYGCTGFTGSLTIPNSITSIGASAFTSCSGFTGSLTIPNSVTSIGNSTFYGCTGFTGSLAIPNSVTSIGVDSFRDCTGLTGSLIIPNSVTSIDQNAFSGCTGFAGSLTIPNLVTSIGANAFANCTGFTGSLTIPDSVTSIGARAFQDCTRFTDVTITNVTPPTISVVVFSGTFPIYVPSESVATYKAATNWSAYAARIFAIV